MDPFQGLLKQSISKQIAKKYLRIQMLNYSCFKQYDIRGVVGKDIDEQICSNIGGAFARILNAKKVVIGHDHK